MLGTITTEILHSHFGFFKLRIDSWYADLQKSYEFETKDREENFNQFELRVKACIEEHSYSVNKFMDARLPSIGKDFNSIGLIEECALAAIIAADKYIHDGDRSGKAQEAYNYATYCMGFINGVRAAIKHELREITNKDHIDNEIKMEFLEKSRRGGLARGQRYEKLKLILYKLVTEKKPTNGWKSMSSCCDKVFDEYLNSARDLPEGRLQILKEPHETNEEQKFRIKRQMCNYLSEWSDRPKYFKPKLHRRRVS